jgi:hypothetical protein
VYLDKKTLAGVFLGWDVDESAVDGKGGGPGSADDSKNGRKSVIEQAINTLAKRGGMRKAKKQGKDRKQSRKNAEAKGQAKGAGKDQKPNDHYRPIKNFKAALLGHIKIATITEHEPTHCQALAGGSASSLLSLDVLRIVQPWVDDFATLKRLCKGHKSCPLLLALDSKKIVFRNVKCSGFPLDMEHLCFWRPPSL